MSSELHVDNTPAGQVINMHSDWDINVTAANDEAVAIFHDRNKNIMHNDDTVIGNDQTLLVKNNDTETITKDRTVNVGGVLTETVTGVVTENYNDSQTTTVKNAITITSKTAHIYLDGCTSIHLHVGASQLCMDSGGLILLQGKHIQIVGSDQVEISGGKVSSTAKSTHDITGENVKSEASVNNTVVGKSMVMLNP
jgi:type VI secretion system secreted protein VgrG